MDTQQRIAQMVREHRVFLFMKGTPDFPQCGFSMRAAGILQALEVPFGSFDVLSDPEIRQGIKEFANWPTIPQLYVDGQFVGGSDIMMEMYESGELESLVRQAPQEEAVDPTAARIRELLAQHRVFLFMKGTPDFPQCGFSMRAASILNALEVPYGSFDVLSDPEIRQGIKEFANWPTIPQLYVDGQFVGGSDIMMEMYESGELESLVKGA